MSASNTLDTQRQEMFDACMATVKKAGIELDIYKDQEDKNYQEKIKYFHESAMRQRDERVKLARSNFESRADTETDPVMKLAIDTFDDVTEMARAGAVYDIEDTIYTYESSIHKADVEMSRVRQEKIKEFEDLFESDRNKEITQKMVDDFVQRLGVEDEKAKFNRDLIGWELNQRIFSINNKSGVNVETAITALFTAGS